MSCHRLLCAMLMVLFAVVAEARIEVRDAKLDTDKCREMAAELKQDGELELFAGEVNEWLALPSVVSVRFAECGEANA